MEVICGLLALRHVFLNEHYYQQQEENQAKILSKIRVIVLTPMKLVELRCGDSEWSYLLEGPSRWGLILDEYQRIFWKLGVAISINALFMIATGDIHQARDARGSRFSQEDLSESASVNIAGVMEDPLRMPFSILPSEFMPITSTSTN